MVNLLLLGELPGTSIQISFFGWLVVALLACLAYLIWSGLYRSRWLWAALVYISVWLWLRRTQHFHTA